MRLLEIKDLHAEVPGVDRWLELFMKHREHIPEAEIRALLRTPAERRRMHLIGQAADWEGMWCLKCGDEWLLIASTDGNATFPVWPHEPYAMLYAVETGRSSFKPVAVSLQEWVNRLSPMLGNRQIDVFPTPTEPGVLLAARELTQELLESCRAYGDEPEDLETIEDE